MENKWGERERERETEGEHFWERRDVGQMSEINENAEFIK